MSLYGKTSLGENEYFNSIQFRKDTMENTPKERNVELGFNKAFSIKLVCRLFEPKSRMSKKALRIFVCNIICFCLISNILFSAQYFYYYLKFQEGYTFGSNYVISKNTLKIPYIVLEWMRNTSQIFCITGIPLAFAANYFFNIRWRELQITIQDLRQETAFPSTFYRRCRIGCFIITVLFLTELVLFCLLNSSEESYYHSIRKAENLKTTYNLSLVLYPFGIRTNNSIEFHESIAIGIGALIQSSLIAILTLFSSITWVASLVAEEITNEMKNESSNRVIEYPKVDQWLRQFHLFHCLVERINRCFGFSLFIALSNICIVSTYNWFFIARRLVNYNFLKLQVVFTEYGRPLILLYFRLTILVIVSQRLQNKGYELRNSFRRIQILHDNIERQIQLETVALQVSVQHPAKIKICDLFHLDFSYVTMIVEMTLTYSIVLYVTTLLRMES